jgi:hypothetical protein
LSKQIEVTDSYKYASLLSYGIDYGCNYFNGQTLACQTQNFLPLLKK